MPEPTPIVPAAYLPFVEYTIRRMLETIAFDQMCRADEDARVRGLAPIESDLYAADVMGRIHVEIALHGLPKPQPEQELATHLHAMRALQR